MQFDYTIVLKHNVNKEVSANYKYFSIIDSIIIVNIADGINYQGVIKFIAFYYYIVVQFNV